VAADPRDRARRVDQRRRGFIEPLDLDRIIIESDPLKRSVEDAMSDALISRPPGGTYTITTAEGSQCSCMNRCPPIPFPCCQCAPHPSRYTLSPGSTPLR
jgi:hypothetical protein